MVGRWFLIVGVLAFVRVAAADVVDDDLALIAKSGPNSAASAEACAARARLSQQGIEILPRLINALDTPNVVAANWYRTIYEPLVQRELARPEPNFPLPLLKEFVRDGRRQGKARRLVLDLVDTLDPVYRTSVIPSLLDDAEFRPDAIAAVLQAGDKALAEGRKEQAKTLFREAFEHGRQTDQVTTAAAKLKPLGEDVNVSAHFGFITDWCLVGPFEAPGYSGFETVFRPEQQPFDEQASFKSAAGPLMWKRHHTPDVLGTVDLGTSLKQCSEAVGYAYAEVESAKEQKVQLRCGADDNLTVWVNGQKVFGRLQWLNGTRMDRFIAPATFKAGRNQVLVKVCQGPQHADAGVTNNWTFQVRFCDESGKGAGLVPVFPPVSAPAAKP